MNSKHASKVLYDFGMCEPIPQAECPICSQLWEKEGEEGISDYQHKGVIAWDWTDSHQCFKHLEEHSDTERKKAKIFFWRVKK